MNEPEFDEEEFAYDEDETDRELALQDEEMNVAEAPVFEELYAEESAQEELDQLREDNPELAARIQYLNDCGVLGLGTVNSIAVADIGEEENSEECPSDPAAETRRIRDFFVDVATKSFDAERAVLLNRKRANTGREEAAERIRETQILKVHFDSALVWIRSRFERLEGGRYPRGVYWPYKLKPNSIDSSVRALGGFVSFLYVKRVLPTGEPFEFALLDDLAQTKAFLHEYIEYFINEKPQHRSSTKKASEYQRRTKMSAADKLRAAGRPLPGTVTSLSLRMPRAFRLLSIANPARGACVWIGDATRKDIEAYVTKNIGAVPAHSSWPLLYDDVLYAMEEQPPESMTDWSKYILLLMMTKFGFRPSCCLKLREKSTVEITGLVSTGILFEDIETISYGRAQDKWKIVFWVTCSKTENNPAYRNKHTITSEDRKGDLARSLVTFFAVRGAFERPLHAAMAVGSPEYFEIKKDFKKLSIFGGAQAGSGLGRSASFSNDRIPLTKYANDVFSWFSLRMGLPERFLTPRSARQGYCFMQCFEYISREDRPIYEECLRRARGMRTWTSPAAGAYLRPNEVPITDLINTVAEEKRRRPHATVDAYEYYLSVSRMIRLPSVQGPTDLDLRSLEAIERFAKEGRYKQLKLKSDAIADEAVALFQQGRSWDDPEMKRILEEWGVGELAEEEYDAKLRKQAAGYAAEARRRAMALIKTDYLRRAIHGNIEVPKLPPLSVLVLDVEGTYALLASRTHCRWEMTRYTATFPLHYKQLCLCPFGCGMAFRTASGIVRHMADAHFAPGEDTPTCRKHQDVEIHSVEDWVGHREVDHKYYNCFECAQGEQYESLGSYERSHVVGTLTLPSALAVLRKRHGIGRLHASETDHSHTKLRGMDGVRLLFRESGAKYPCGCSTSRCPFHDNQLILPLLNNEYLTAGALSISRTGQGATRWNKWKWFEVMAKGLLLDSTYSANEIEECLNYYFCERYP